MLSQDIAASQPVMFSLLPGKQRPFGASLQAQGCNFSIYSPDAEAVLICLFDENEQELAQITLTQRVQSTWFGCIANLAVGQFYGIRVKPKPHRRFIEFSEEKLLIDPYAKALSRALNWNKEKYQGDSQGMLPKCVVTQAPYKRFAPQTLSPEQRIVYEVHVKGLSMLHPEVPVAQRGTYVGARHPTILAHLKSLGVTSIQFLPLMSFMPEPFAVEKGLSNYWGYNPVNFFAPEPRYAIDNALLECREMISAYREEGFEVILDVVFNHTAEGGLQGPVLSFKGLCANHAYLFEQFDETDSPEFVNYSGCGNTIKASDTFMQTLILDAMRYWVSDMGVSGFRFDLAATLGREPTEYRSYSGLFKMIQQDPVLKTVTLIAEPWDIGPGGYQLGHFPATWMEVNDKFRDCVRAFWRGDKALKGEFATRFMGSKDIFRKNIRPMYASLNHVTYHDGFTLHDVVSYEQKHNDANLEDNRDGHNHNLSCNYGVEGETHNPDIIKKRAQQKRNMFATLLLSQGTPHILGGDELSRTQKGNNNAYCQDNLLNYMQWELSAQQQSFLSFCRDVISLRQQHPLLQQMHFADDQYCNFINIAAAEWYRQDGSHKRDIDWVMHEHHCFALHIVASHTSAEMPPQQWVFCVNSADSATLFTLEVFVDSEYWQCMLDTACDDQKSCKQRQIFSSFELPAHSLQVFKKY